MASKETKEGFEIKNDTALIEQANLKSREIIIRDTEDLRNDTARLERDNKLTTAFSKQIASELQAAHDRRNSENPILRDAQKSIDNVQLADTLKKNEQQNKYKGRIGSVETSRPASPVPTNAEYKLMITKSTSDEYKSSFTIGDNE